MEENKQQQPHCNHNAFPIPPWYTEDSLSIKLGHLPYGHLSSADVSTYGLEMQVYLMSKVWPFITVA